MKELIIFIVSLITTDAYGALSFKEYMQVTKNMRKVYPHQFYYHYTWKSDEDWIYSKATRSGKQHILLNGGFARKEVMTQDMFAFALCREQGIFIGGSPRLDVQRFTYYGQQPYFAASKCMKLYFEKMDNISFVKTLNPERVAVADQICGDVKKDADEKAICIRTLIAAEEYYQDVYADSARKFDPIYPRLENEIVEAVSKTKRGTVGSQCNLDSVVAGALCDEDPRSKVATMIQMLVIVKMVSGQDLCAGMLVGFQNTNFQGRIRSKFIGLINRLGL